MRPRQDSDRASRLDLLQFQIGELDALDTREGELQNLQAEHEEHRNADQTDRNPEVVQNRRQDTGACR